jgi:hypothetical protein
LAVPHLPEVLAEVVVRVELAKQEHLVKEIVAAMVHLVEAQRKTWAAAAVVKAVQVKLLVAIKLVMVEPE